MISVKKESGSYGPLFLLLLIAELTAQICYYALVITTPAFFL